MKKKNAGKTILTWNSMSFKDPYKVIIAIYDAADVETYRDFIRDILLYSTRTKQYRKEHGGNMRFYLDGIICLLNACFIIGKNKKHSLLELRDEDMLNSKFYSLHTLESKRWSDFPRSLTQSETLNPYKVFGKIFKHHNPDKWSDILKYLADDACSSYSDKPDENLLEVYIQLTKLFEATHLIYVREIEHIGNWREAKTEK